MRINNMASKATFTIINGTLGQKPELRHTTNGREVCTVGVAHNTRWKGQDGQLHEKTDWFNVKLFGKLAVTAHNYLDKGSRVFLEGNISTSKYDKNGVTIYATDLIADKMIFLSSKKEDQHRSDGGYPEGYGNTHSTTKPSNAPQTFMADDPNAFQYDDIPF